MNVMNIKAKAIMELQPNIEFKFEGEVFTALNGWHLPTEEEIQAKIAELEAEEPMRLLRLERNRRLANVDWVVIRAYSQKQDLSEDWANYMQALRDLPANSEPQLDDDGNLTNIDWPEVPNA
tara:strand:+ start:55 stop:420 length:366 start_codon:yes stop_codon:yes gene_type:complete